MQWNSDQDSAAKSNNSHKAFSSIQVDSMRLLSIMRCCQLLTGL